MLLQFRYLMVIPLLGFSHGAGDYDHASHGYEFIYHDSHDLMLIIHNNKCYYASLADSRAEEILVSQQRVQFEAGVIQWLSQPHHGAPTTLDNVRDEFRDRLADYHCMNREIYFFNITFTLHQ